MKVALQARCWPSMLVGCSSFRDWRVAADEVDAFVELSGDASPIHVDDGEARQRGFRGRVVHGALLVAKVSAVLGMDLPGPAGVLVALRMEWPAPVHLGDLVRIEAEVIDREERARLLRLRVRARRIDAGEAETTVGRGEASCLVRF